MENGITPVQRGFGTKMPTHSGGIFENFTEKAPLHIESQNNFVPKPFKGKII